MTTTPTRLLVLCCIFLHVPANNSMPVPLRQQLQPPPVTKIHKHMHDNVLRMRGGTPGDRAAKIASTCRSEDYYEILGVTKECSGEDVKRAYRRLALQIHPDKNPGNVEQAAMAFKKVSEAYEVLSDPGKRDTYDRFGKEGANNMDGDAFNFKNAEDIFKEFFGGANPFAAFDNDDNDGFGMGGGLNSVFSQFCGGDMGGVSFTSSSSFGSSGGGGGAVSMSTETFFRNGARVTRTVRRFADGRTEQSETFSTPGAGSRDWIDHGGQSGRSSSFRGPASSFVGGGAPSSYWDYQDAQFEDGLSEDDIAMQQALEQSIRMNATGKGRAADGARLVAEEVPR